MKMYLALVLVLVVCLGFCQVEGRAATTQSKKSAQAMLESIRKTLMAEQKVAAANSIKGQGDDDFIKLQGDNDDDGIKQQDDDDSIIQLGDAIIAGGVPSLPGGEEINQQEAPDGAIMANVPKVPGEEEVEAEGIGDDNVSIQGRYVRIPYYMWKKIWVYYYYTYYRNYALRHIRG